jgi:hypothetical protein
MMGMDQKVQTGFSGWRFARKNGRQNYFLFQAISLDFSE